MHKTAGQAYHLLNGRTTDDGRRRTTTTTTTYHDHLRLNDYGCGVGAGDGGWVGGGGPPPTPGANHLANNSAWGE